MVKMEEQLISDYKIPVTRKWHDSFLSKYIILPADINRTQRLQLFFLEFFLIQLRTIYSLLSQ
jgi:hypothetical protein